MPNDIFNLAPVKCKSEDRADLLDKIRWADTFTWEQTSKLAANMQLYNLKKNTIIFTEGSQKPILGIIIEGNLHVIKKDDQDNYNILSKLSPSQSFGEMSFIDGQAASASVVAATDTQLLILTKEKFDEFAKTNSNLALKLIMYIAKMLSQRLRRTSGKLVDYLSE